MKRLSPDQIRQVYDRGPDAVVDLVTQLFDVIERLEAQVQGLQVRVAELERQVNRNSRNSSQPPSADGLKKPPPRSQRRPSGRPRGGQPGHPGETLKMADNPETVIRHPVSVCESCGEMLADVAVDEVRRRQVFDIPPLNMMVTEHRADVKTCPRCDAKTVGTFPEGIVAPTQYGPHLLGLATYLQTFQMLPVERIREFFAALWGHAPSGRTIVDAARRVSEVVGPVLTMIRDALHRAPVVHVDETGFRVEGTLWWMHTATADGWTLYGLHRKRGHEGIDSLGVMTDRQGVAVHDFWKPYYRCGGRHALCNAHLLRDLTGLYEVTGESWVAQLGDLLVDMHRAASAARDSGHDHVAPDRYTSYHALYDTLVHHGRQRHPEPEPSGRRGRVKRDLAQNLLTRLETHRSEILAFFDDITIPFDNNAAERALRMMKVKQKVSGSFRSEQGGHIFAAIRSYVVTARQQGQSPLAVLRAALAGHPWQPS